MLVMPSKVMASELAKYFKDKDIIESIRYVEMDYQTWHWYVNSFNEPTKYDINPRNGKCKAICVRYDSECYAMPNYLDFRTLNKLTKDCNHSFDTFMKNVWKEIEV